MEVSLVTVAAFNKAVLGDMKPAQHQRKEDTVLSGIAAQLPHTISQPLANHTHLQQY
jgi:hypothetical protein